MAAAIVLPSVLLYQEVILGWLTIDTSEPHELTFLYLNLWGR